MDAAIIETRGLAKRYGSVTALDELDLSIAPGAVGLLGPNGAGKTTLLKLCLGLLVPDAGEARVVGHDPRKRSARLEMRRAVGYMPEGDCLLPSYTALDLVLTLARVTGLEKADAITRAHEVLDYVGLEEERYRSLEQYSTGMKQRLKLAQALVHDPEVLLLDEPTNGLDPAGRREVLDLVHDLSHNQGKNVLLCSHLLPDVERTCDRVVVIHRGRSVGAGSIADMTRGEGREVRVTAEGEVAAFVASLETAGYRVESEGGGRLLVGLGSDEEDADELLSIAARSGAWLSTLQPLRSSLEDVFLSVLEEAES